MALEPLRALARRVREIRTPFDAAFSGDLAEDLPPLSGLLSFVSSDEKTVYIAWILHQVRDLQQNTVVMLKKHLFESYT